MRAFCGLEGMAHYCYPSRGKAKMDHKMSKPPREIWTFRWITNGKYGAFNVGKPTESEKACFLGRAEVIEFREITAADEAKDEALKEAKKVITRLVKGFDQSIPATPLSYAADDCRNWLKKYGDPE